MQPKASTFLHWSQNSLLIIPCRLGAQLSLQSQISLSCAHTSATLIHLTSLSLTCSFGSCISIVHSLSWQRIRCSHSYLTNWPQSCTPACYLYSFWLFWYQGEHHEGHMGCTETFRKTTGTSFFMYMYFLGWSNEWLCKRHGNFKQNLLTQCVTHKGKLNITLGNILLWQHDAAGTA